VIKFKEYRDKCPWNQGRWCKPMNNVGERRAKCESSECPFWCLRYLIVREKERR